MMKLNQNHQYVNDFEMKIEQLQEEVLKKSIQIQDLYNKLKQSTKIIGEITSSRVKEERYWRENLNMLDNQIFMQIKSERDKIQKEFSLKEQNLDKQNQILQLDLQILQEKYEILQFNYQNRVYEEDYQTITKIDQQQQYSTLDDQSQQFYSQISESKNDEEKNQFIQILDHNNQDIAIQQQDSLNIQEMNVNDDQMHLEILELRQTVNDLESKLRETQNNALLEISISQEINESEQQKMRVQIQNETQKKFESDFSRFQEQLAIKEKEFEEFKKQKEEEIEELNNRIQILEHNLEQQTEKNQHYNSYEIIKQIKNFDELKQKEQADKIQNDQIYCSYKSLNEEEQKPLIELKDSELVNIYKQIKSLSPHKQISLKSFIRIEEEIEKSNPLFEKQKSTILSIIEKEENQNQENENKLKVLNQRVRMQELTIQDLKMKIDDYAWKVKKKDDQELVLQQTINQLADQIVVLNKNYNSGNRKLISNLKQEDSLINKNVKEGIQQGRKNRFNSLTTSFLEQNNSLQNKIGQSENFFVDDKDSQQVNQQFRAKFKNKIKVAMF